MPLNRLWVRENLQDEEERKAEIEELSQQLEAVHSQREIWDSQAAHALLMKLQEEESSALEQMLNGPPEGMIEARAKAKVIRSLLREPEELAREQARLEAAIAALEGEV